MARVTVEDCVTLIPNRFDLVMVAAQRVRDITGGASMTVDRDNDKMPVIALREIAANNLNLPDLQEALVRGHQRVFEIPESEDELVEFMEGEQGWTGPITMGSDLDGMGVVGADGEADDDLEIDDEDDDETEDGEKADLEDINFGGGDAFADDAVVDD